MPSLSSFMPPTTPGGTVGDPHSTDQSHHTNTTAAPSAVCGVHRTYLPSAWELWWTERVATLSVDWLRRGCVALCSGPCQPQARLEANDSNALTMWLTHSRQRALQPQASGLRPTKHPPAFTSEVLGGVPGGEVPPLGAVVSYHRVVASCADHGGADATLALIPIEPLVGSLRHPFHLCVKQRSMSARRVSAGSQPLSALGLTSASAAV